MRIEPNIPVRIVKASISHFVKFNFLTSVRHIYRLALRPIAYANAQHPTNIFIINARSSNKLHIRIFVSFRLLLPPKMMLILMLMDETLCICWMASSVARLYFRLISFKVIAYTVYLWTKNRSHATSVLFFLSEKSPRFRQEKKT